MQQIRMSLRGKAVVLMGKNTMMRKAIRGHLENNPALEKSVSLSSLLSVLLFQERSSAEKWPSPVNFSLQTVASHPGERGLRVHQGGPHWDQGHAAGQQGKGESGWLEWPYHYFGSWKATKLTDLRLCLERKTSYYSHFCSGASCRPCWCHSTVWSHCAGPEHWSGAREDLLLPGFRHHHQDLQGHHWNPGEWTWLASASQASGRGSVASDLPDVQGLTANSLVLQSDVQLIKTGDKVGASEATLLNMLNISPFSFGLVIQQVFDNGSIYNPEVLDITEETLHSRFLEVPEGAFQALPFWLIVESWSGFSWILAMQLSSSVITRNSCLICTSVSSSLKWQWQYRIIEELMN